MEQVFPYVDETDSSATIMRGVAAALHGEWMEPQIWPAHLVQLAGPANRLPEAVRVRAVQWLVRNTGVSPEWAPRVTTDGLARWAVDLYERDQPEKEQFDAVVIGAPSGGAGHLAALLSAPFLSQHFVTRYRYRGHPDEIARYQAFGAPLAETIVANNPDLAVVNHYDPIHDRFLVSSVNYIRMKLLELPAAYRTFIERHLRPGGTILFTDCHYSWGQYRISRRHYFQVGGLGGIPDADWVNGSSQVEDFLAQHGRPGQQSWSLPYPWLPGVESEWGALAPLETSVEAFAAQRGFRFRVLRGSHPEDFSRLAYFASYQAALNAGREPNGVLVDCFTQTSPTAALRADLLPVWLPFNCTDSLDFLRQMAGSFPHSKPVLLAPVPSFSPSWDVASVRDWETAASGTSGARNASSVSNVQWVGIDRRAFPADLAGMFRFVPALKAWCSTVARTRRNRNFGVADLETLIARMAAQASGEAQAESNITVSQRACR